MPEGRGGGRGGIYRARRSGAREHRQAVTLADSAKADTNAADSIHGVGLGSRQTVFHCTLSVFFLLLVPPIDKKNRQQITPPLPPLPSRTPRPSPKTKIKGKITPRSLSSCTYAAPTASRSLLRDDYDIVLLFLSKQGLPLNPRAAVGVRYTGPDTRPRKSSLMLPTAFCQRQRSGKGRQRVDGGKGAEGTNVPGREGEGEGGGVLMSCMAGVV